MRQNMERTGIEPPKRVVFMVSEPLTEGLRGSLMDGNQPLGTVTVQSSEGTPDGFEISGRLE
jgi:hypothetical protein